MKTPMVSSATSFQRLQTSLQSPMPRLPRSNVYSTRDPANPSASVHRKRFFTPSLTLKFLCAGYLNPGDLSSGGNLRHGALIVLINLAFQPSRTRAVTRARCFGDTCAEKALVSQYAAEAPIGDSQRK